MNMYRDTDNYTVHTFKTREEWLKKRIQGIGGSDSSILVEKNPYKTNNRLWHEKKGLVKVKELSNPAIEHGNDLEPVLRLWFQRSYKNYDVQYKENTILQSKINDWQFYSPDGLLFNDKLGKGILEIKTTLIQNSNMLEQWNDSVPQQYYAQVIHGLLVTNFDYVVVVVELRFAWNEDKVEIRKYLIKRDEVEEDLKWLMSKELHNWNEYYVKDKEPPTVLKM